MDPSQQFQNQYGAPAVGMYTGADGGMQQQHRSPPKPVAIGIQAIDPKDVAQKTPISLLQECCTRKGVTPMYELLSTEGKVHEPTFGYRCVLEGYIGVGQGKSKKVAKHLASMEVLTKIVDSGQHIQWYIPGRSPQEARHYLEGLLADVMGGEGEAKKSESGENQAEGGGDGGAVGAKDNPVGRLNEKCTKNRWPLPVWEEQDATGMPHERMFIVKCKLGKFEETGEAKGKKVAKRISAEKMLKFLEGMPKPEGLELGDDELAERFKTAVKGLGKKVKSLRPNDLQTVESFFHPMTTNPSEGLRGLGGGAGGKKTKTPGEYLAKSDACRRILAKIADEHHFRLTYVDLEKRGDGQYQCLVQLSTMPVAVCYGSGKSRDEAQWSAAHNALYYLKVMTTGGPTAASENHQPAPIPS